MFVQCSFYKFPIGFLAGILQSSFSQFLKVIPGCNFISSITSYKKRSAFTRFSESHSLIFVVISIHKKYSTLPTFQYGDAQQMLYYYCYHYCFYLFQLYQYSWINGPVDEKSANQSRIGRCIMYATNYTIARSPAFDIDGEC